MGFLNLQMANYITKGTSRGQKNICICILKYILGKCIVKLNK